LLCLIFSSVDYVILFGHSYGGMVIGGVAEKIPDKIRHLVYLDGYIPEDGKTAFDLIPGLEDLQEKILEWTRQRVVACTIL
jgi:pimeloyl-ACP methyl ester carboxylesterase